MIFKYSGAIKFEEFAHSEITKKYSFIYVRSYENCKSQYGIFF